MAFFSFGGFAGRAVPVGVAVLAVGRRGVVPSCLLFKRNKIAFEDAKRIFDGPTVERVDDRFDYGEIRVYAIGLVNGLEITVIYTDRDGDERHLISAWRSEPHERRHYWQNLEAAQDRH